MRSFVKSLLLLTALFILGAGLASCSKDDDGPSCKMCAVSQVVYLDGVEFGSQTLPETELCDEALDEVEANPTTTVTQNLGGITQEAVITYSCQ